MKNTTTTGIPTTHSGTTRHDVYWGTHGCDRTKGHANPCLCDCKTTLPLDHEYVFGDDAATAVRDPGNVIGAHPCM
jgi:hypothetical protein